MSLSDISDYDDQMESMGRSPGTIGMASANHPACWYFASAGSGCTGYKHKDRENILDAIG